MPDFPDRAGRTDQPRSGPDLTAEAVTALFVPGDRPDRYPKAAAAGPDVVIIDLEDAVAPTTKDHARACIASWLTGPGPDLRALVRINPPDGALGQADLAMLESALRTNRTSDTGSSDQDSAGQLRLLGVMVPKAEDPNVLGSVAARLAAAGGSDGLAVVALIETAAGIANADAIAAVPGLTRLAFGAIDFAADIGAEVDAFTGQFARAQLVIAARVAGLPAPLESPATELRDLAAVEATSRAARSTGFGGRLCIHPVQLAPVRAGFSPTEAELNWARQVLAAGESAARVDDQMVDKPVLTRAQSLLRRAGINTVR